LPIIGRLDVYDKNHTLLMEHNTVFFFVIC
jgi:hypothetical protein